MDPDKVGGLDFPLYEKFATGLRMALENMVKQNVAKTPTYSFVNSVLKPLRNNYVLAHKADLKINPDDPKFDQVIRQLILSSAYLPSGAKSTYSDIDEAVAAVIDLIRLGTPIRKIFPVSLLNIYGDLKNEELLDRLRKFLKEQRRMLADMKRADAKAEAEMMAKRQRPKVKPDPANVQLDPRVAKPFPKFEFQPSVTKPMTVKETLIDYGSQSRPSFVFDRQSVVKPEPSGRVKPEPFGQVKPEPSGQVKDQLELPERLSNPGMFTENVKPEPADLALEKAAGLTTRVRGCREGHLQEDIEFSEDCRRSLMTTELNAAKEAQAFYGEMAKKFPEYETYVGFHRVQALAAGGKIINRIETGLRPVQKKGSIGYPVRDFIVNLVELRSYMVTLDEVLYIMKFMHGRPRPTKSKSVQEITYQDPEDPSITKTLDLEPFNSYMTKIQTHIGKMSGMIVVAKKVQRAQGKRFVAKEDRALWEKFISTKTHTVPFETTRDALASLYAECGVFKQILQRFVVEYEFYIPRSIRLYANRTVEKCDLDWLAMFVKKPDVRPDTSNQMLVLASLLSIILDNWDGIMKWLYSEAQTESQSQRLAEEWARIPVGPGSEYSNISALKDVWKARYGKDPEFKAIKKAEELKAYLKGKLQKSGIWLDTAPGGEVSKAHPQSFKLKEMQNDLADLERLEKDYDRWAAEVRKAKTAKRYGARYKARQEETAIYNAYVEKVKALREKYLQLDKIFPKSATRLMSSLVRMYATDPQFRDELLDTDDPRHKFSETTLDRVERGIIPSYLEFPPGTSVITKLLWYIQPRKGIKDMMDPENAESKLVDLVLPYLVKYQDKEIFQFLNLDLLSTIIDLKEQLQSVISGKTNNEPAVARSLFALAQSLDKLEEQENTDWTEDDQPFTTEDSDDEYTKDMEDVTGEHDMEGATNITVLGPNASRIKKLTNNLKTIPRGWARRWLGTSTELENWVNESLENQKHRIAFELVKLAFSSPKDIIIHKIEKLEQKLDFAGSGYGVGPHGAIDEQTRQEMFKIARSQADQVEEKFRYVYGGWAFSRAMLDTGKTKAQP